MRPATRSTGWTSGVETTTGPLGQGRGHQRRHGHRATLARRPLQPARLRGPDRLQRLRHLRRRLHDGGHLASEAASLAGHLRLSNLCWIYDNNHITIEGNTALAFTEDAACRFLGYGWNVDPGRRRQRPGDARPRPSQSFRTTSDRPDAASSSTATSAAARRTSRTPARAHGEPLGEEEIRLAKRNYGWPEDAQFLVPDGVREDFNEGLGARGKAARDAWGRMFQRYRRDHA